MIPRLFFIRSVLGLSLLLLAGGAQAQESAPKTRTITFGQTAALGGPELSRPACDEAVWWFLGLSMAGWNVLISLKLAIWSAIAAVWRPADVG